MQIRIAAAILVCLAACSGAGSPSSTTTGTTSVSPTGSTGSPVTPGVPAGSPAPSRPGAGAPGYLHTNGSDIVDSSGETVRLTGVSWFGMETANFAPHGLWTKSMADMLDAVKRLGYNSIRVPYSNELFDAASKPNSIDLAKNPDLAGLDGLGILDKLVAGAKARGLRIILDRHRPDAGGQSELWYTSRYNEQRWIADWQMLAKRYKGDPTVIGCDLHNEPHGTATWGDGNPLTDWRLAAERAGNAIHDVNPDLLIIVEGVEAIGGETTWWGGNLKAAGDAPVRLQQANRVVYSPHDYPATVYPQKWFSDPTFPANLPAVWDTHWGYLVKNKIAPVWIGEFGTKDTDPRDQQWLRSLAGYIEGQGLSFAFWSLNPDSGDTGGILQDDWTTVNADKQAVIQPLLAPLP
jgi:endoglucanase